MFAARDPGKDPCRYECASSALLVGGMWRLALRGCVLVACDDDAVQVEPCAFGTFDPDGDPATACVVWTDCSPGEYVAFGGNTVTDRVCAPCPAETFSTETNAAACTPWLACSPGEHVSAAGTTTADRSCAACASGSFTAVASAATCAAWSDCVAGEYVAAEGDVTSDRLCAACASGSFSTDANAPGCTLWTTCVIGDEEVTPGTATSDRTCRPDAWLHQFGSISVDQAAAVTAGNNGMIVVAGATGDALPGQTHLGGIDAFIRAYDAGGKTLWTRQFGTSTHDYVLAVRFSTSGDIVVAGSTDGALSGQTSSGSADAFIQVYDASGALLWTRQFGTSGSDVATALDLANNDNIIVVGATTGSLAAPNNDEQDPFVRAYDASGGLLWTRQIGTPSFDVAHGVGVDAAGNIAIAGRTHGTLPGQTNAGLQDAFIQAYDPNGNVRWIRQFGTSGGDEVGAISVHGDGRIAVAGQSPSMLSSSYDGFVRTYDADGIVLWTDSFGSGVGTRTTSMATSISRDGDIVVSGATDGALPGQTNASPLGSTTDAFVRSYADSGAVLWTHQFGTTGNDYAMAVSFDDRDTIVAVGTTALSFPGQTSSGSSDAYVRRMVPP